MTNREVLFVFDLDFTLWNCGGTFVDATRPPFITAGEKVYDSLGEEMILYPHVPEILKDLYQSGHPLGIASRTHEPDWAMELMRIFKILAYFTYFEIFPGSKIPHFHNHHQKTGIPFNQMIFFDDELRNINEVSQLGVNTFHVSNGINNKIYRESLKLINWIN